MKIKAVIWDIGGVIVRTQDWTPRQELAKRLGRTMREIEIMVWGDESDLRPQIGEISAQEKWEAVRQALHLSPQGLQDFRQEFFAGDILDVDLLAWIGTLRPRYRTGVITNALDDARDYILRNGIDKFFDTITISAEVGVTKPDARIYHLTLAAMGHAPGETVFVDDFEPNIAGAQIVGMHTVHFKNKTQTLRDLSLLLDGSITETG